MRSVILGAASALALLAPAAANAESPGYVDASVGQIDFDGSDLDMIGFGGAVAADVSPNWRVQFDGDVTRYSDNGAFTTTNVTAHLYTEGDNYAVGAVLSNRDLIFASIWSLGVEGQTAMGPVVLEGEAGFGTLEAFSNDAGTVNASVNGTYYASDNFSIGAGVGYLDSDDAFGTIMTYSVDAEYKFDSPVSLFVGYANSDYDDISADSDTWRLGARYSFGDDTLRNRRETGPRWLRETLSIVPFA